MRRTRPWSLFIATFCCLGCASSHQRSDDLPGAAGTDVPAGLPAARVAALSSLTTGRGRTCAVDDAGSVLCWGAALLADGSLAAERTPVALDDLGPASTVALGGSEHSSLVCSVLSAGGVVCSGIPSEHDGTAAAPVPTTFRLPQSESVAQVAVTTGRVCGVTTAGSVLCWGPLTDLGACSLQDLTPRPLTDPPTVMNELAPARRVKVSGGATCVVQGDDRVRCTVHTARRGEPSEAATKDLFEGASDVHVQHSESCYGLGLSVCAAVGSRVECRERDLFDEAWMSEARTVPIATPTDIRRIAAVGWETLCVETTANDVFCASLGAETASSVRVLTDIVEASGTGAHFCARDTSGVTRCWGNNEWGQVGNGHASHVETPVQVPGLRDVTHVASGAWHTCARSEHGEVWCWGMDVAATFGRGGWTTPALDVAFLDPSAAAFPHPFAGPTLQEGLAEAASVFASDRRTCVSDLEGVYCWGAELTARLAMPEPTRIDGVPSAVSVAAGDDSDSCSVDASGQVRCWGRGYFGTRSGVETVALPGPAAQVDGGTHLACARLVDGEVYCWGGRFDGSLTNGAPARPARVASAAGAVDLSGTCAVTRASELVCWDPAAPAAGPVVLAGDVIEVDGNCVIRASGAVACRQAFGQRGAPVLDGFEDVPGITEATAIAVGAEHACALRRDGTVWCWGAVASGRLGQGSMFFTEGQVVRVATSL